MGLCRKNSCHFQNVTYLDGNLKKPCDILNTITDSCGKKLIQEKRNCPYLERNKRVTEDSFISTSY